MRLQFRFALASAVLVLVGLNPALASEFRGLYVDAFHPGFKSHEEVTQMVAAAKAANFNALIVQVRKRGDAYYNSKVERKGYDIAPEYDPLADVIGFIRHQGAAFCCVGCWKAYTNEEQARRTFALYRKCRMVYLACYHNKGYGVTRLTVAA